MPPPYLPTQYYLWGLRVCLSVPAAAFFFQTVCMRECVNEAKCGVFVLKVSCIALCRGIICAL